MLIVESPTLSFCRIPSVTRLGVVCCPRLVYPASSCKPTGYAASTFWDLLDFVMSLQNRIVRKLLQGSLFEDYKIDYYFSGIPLDFLISAVSHSLPPSACLCWPGCASALVQFLRRHCESHLLIEAATAWPLSGGNATWDIPLPQLCQQYRKPCSKALQSIWVFVLIRAAHMNLLDRCNCCRRRPRHPILLRCVQCPVGNFHRSAGRTVLRFSSATGTIMLVIARRSFMTGSE